MDITSLIVEAAELFRENVENLEQREQYGERIKRLESKGDEFVQLLISQLNKNTSRRSTGKIFSNWSPNWMTFWMALRLVPNVRCISRRQHRS